MWKEITSVEEINNEEIVAYLEANPAESLIDTEDEEFADFTTRKFTVDNRFEQTMVYIECDKSLIDSKQNIQMQVSGLN